MIGVSLLVFPRLTLGLSGFETGVSMMPLVRGDTEDDPERPEGRIRNSRKMLLVAALIMHFYLLTRSFVTTLLIPKSEFDPNEEAQGRALAYVAHEHLGNAIGTIYYISTITILWFAGASAMAGLLNVVPRYLPRYGTEEEYARRGSSARTTTSRVRSRFCSLRYRSRTPRSSWRCSRSGASRSEVTRCCVA